MSTHCANSHFHHASERRKNAAELCNDIIIIQPEVLTALYKL